jgi:hypothetical protein
LFDRKQLVIEDFGVRVSIKNNLLFHAKKTLL